jgi:hypothetical protein
MKKENRKLSIPQVQSDTGRSLPEEALFLELAYKRGVDEIFGFFRR